MADQMDITAKVEDLQNELQSISKAFTLFHVFLDEGDSIPSADTLISLAWGFTRYLDRISDDLGDVASVLRKREQAKKISDKEYLERSIRASLQA